MLYTPLFCFIYSLLFLNLLLLFFTLQYCIGFATHHHESATSVHVFPIPKPHPSGSSQCTSPEHPAPCIEPRLAIHFLYDIIHVSMPFSQIIPPSPSPTESKICSVHLCLFCCLAYKVIITIFLNSTYMC